MGASVFRRGVYGEIHLPHQPNHNLGQKHNRAYTREVLPHVVIYFRRLLVFTVNNEERPGSAKA